MVDTKQALITCVDWFIMFYRKFGATVEKRDDITKLEEGSPILGRFIIVWLLACLFASIAVICYYYLSMDRFTDEILVEEKRSLPIQKQIIRSALDNVQNDLMFLSIQNELIQGLTEWNAQNKGGIISEYRNLSSFKPEYNQIRFIDQDGLEKVRVDHRNNEVVTVADEDLQDKSGRYYFELSIKLNKGEIYVSPLDLNMEMGEIEYPFNPMIRFATPVFDRFGEKKGVVVINYAAEGLLQDIEKAGPTLAETMLLNEDGYWLLSPDESNEWGFMLEDRQDANFSKHFPAEWKTISLDKTRQFSTKNGIFYYDRVFPLLNQLDTGATSPDGYSWLLISRVNPQVITKYRSSLLQSLAAITFLLLIILAAIVWPLVQAIEARRLYRQSLINLSFHDPLTGLANRSYFSNRLEQAVAHGKRHSRRMALLYIDLDDFKKVNDTMGHAAGDELLICIAQVLLKNTRKSDVVARLGGDEFAIILFEINTVQDAMNVANKIMTLVSQPQELESGSAKVGASIGVAIYPDTTDHIDELITKADAAMYESKRKGKNNSTLAN